MVSDIPHSPVLQKAANILSCIRAYVHDIFEFSPGIMQKQIEMKNNNLKYRYNGYIKTAFVTRNNVVIDNASSPAHLSQECMNFRN